MFLFADAKWMSPFFAALCAALANNQIVAPPVFTGGVIGKTLQAAAKKIEGSGISLSVGSYIGHGQNNWPL